MEPYTAHYFFSAVFQGDATILSISLGFTFIRIQSLESELQFTKEFLHNAKNSIRSQDVLEFEGASNEHREKIITGNPPVAQWFRKWIRIESRLESIKQLAKRFLIPLFAVTCLSVFGMIYASFLNHLGRLLLSAIGNLLAIGYAGYEIYKFL